MRRILTLAAIAVLVVALAAASPASAKQVRCGAYAKSDGSLANSVMTNIAVVGMSCAAGQTVANGYHGPHRVVLGLRVRVRGRAGLAAIEGVGAVRQAPPADDL